jgi:hypothetical protein
MERGKVFESEWERLKNEVKKWKEVGPIFIFSKATEIAWMEKIEGDGGLNQPNEI